ncbi:MAG: M2 family metallopeptidase [Rubrobacter sp.]|nr:M2 family metallopeptidase [Rubrobacter sp.]
MIPPSELERFISDFEERLAPVERAADAAWWTLATSGTEEAQEEFVGAGKEFNGLFSDRGEYEMLRSLYEDLDSVESPLLRRRVEVLYRTFAERQGDGEILGRIEELEAEANAIYGNHSSIVGGRKLVENEVRELLRSSEDEDLRREAWEASKSVGREVEGTVRELARLRNQLAREQGYKNYYARSLKLQEIEARELAGIMDELASATDAPFQELKNGIDAGLRRKFGVDEVMPWHLSGPFFHRAPDVAGVDLDGYFEGRDLEELTRRTFDGLGLDVRSVISNSDLYEREGKSQHAFCTRIGREYPYDVRVLANVRPDANWMDAMLHEFGHAVYDRHVNPRLPYLLRTYAHANTTEAIALMMGALIDDPGWLRSVAGAAPEDVDRDAAKLATHRRVGRMILTRLVLIMYHFEQALYADPDSEGLNSVWWDLVERFLYIERPPGRDEPDWAAVIHVAVAPVYFHNYMLGELISAQLRNYLESHITQGPFYENEVAGRYLLESFFGPGARENWRDTVLRATGEPLNPEHFVNSLG